LKLKGSGNTVELGIAGIDGNNLELLQLNSSIKQESVN